MGRGIVKVAVGHSGGAAHVAYITRETALVGELTPTPDYDLRQAQTRAVGEASSRTDTVSGERDKQVLVFSDLWILLGGELPNNDSRSDEKAERVDRASEEGVRAGVAPIDISEIDVSDAPDTSKHNESDHRDDAPIWTWNTLDLVTGDGDGSAAYKASYAYAGGRIGSRAMRERERNDAPEQRHQSPEHQPALTVEEKRRNAIAHFSALADYEEHLGGVSHLRIIFTVSGETDNLQLRDITLSFLQGSFPASSALVTVHRDTDHVHVHIHIPSRNLDDKRLSLGQEYFRLDERLLEVAARHLRDPEMLAEHLRLKRETLAYKRGVREDREAGRPLRPKPDRHSDHWEVEHGRVRPFDDHYAGRIEQAVEVAKARLEYERVRGATAGELEEAERRQGDLRQKQSEIYNARNRARSSAKREGLESIPTIGEVKELLVLRQATERLKRENQERTVREIEAKLNSIEQRFFAESEDIAGAEWAINEKYRNAQVRTLAKLKFKEFETYGGGGEGRLLAGAGYTREKIESDSERALEREAKRQQAIVERRAEMRAVVIEHSDAFLKDVLRREGAFWGFDEVAVAKHTQALQRELNEELEGRGWTLESAGLDARWSERAADIIVNNKESHHNLARLEMEFVGGYALGLELLKDAAQRRGDESGYESFARSHEQGAREYKQLEAKGRECGVEVHGLRLPEEVQDELIAVRSEILDRQWHKLIEELHPDVQQSLAASIERMEVEQRRNHQQLEEQRRDQEQEREQGREAQATQRVGEITRDNDSTAVTTRRDGRTEPKPREREAERIAPVLIR